MEKIVLCLPLGLSNGGVTTWTVSLAKRLEDAGIDAEILAHTNPYSSGFQPPAGAKIKTIPGLDAWRASASEIVEFLPAYASSIQGSTVIAPGFSWSAYATAALLAICRPGDVRLLGICHTDEEHYYELLSYYEPVMGKIIGVSSEIVAKLKVMLPHRAEDIVKLVYPVEVAASPREVV